MSTIRVEEDADVGVYGAGDAHDTDVTETSNAKGTIKAFKDSSRLQNRCLPN